MDHFDDLEFKEERSVKNQQQPIKKHIPLKLKSNNAQPIIKLNSQSVIKQPPSVQQPQQQHQQQQLMPMTNQQTQSFNFDSNHINKTEQEFPHKRPYNEMNTDFTIKRSHTIEKLNWNFNTNSSNTQKVMNQTMDFCMICNLPILIYGRLIPCKHVMCAQCAKSIELKVCLKESCNEIIDRIDTALRGGIFVCNYDMETVKQNHHNYTENYRLNPDLSQKRLCGRSYMSQRDLNSHIQHRHDANFSVSSSSSSSNSTSSLTNGNSSSSNNNSVSSTTITTNTMYTM